MNSDQPQLSNRSNIFYFAVSVILIVFVFRLFYLQVLRHDYYANLAQASQLKQYEIPADRGGVYAFDGNDIVPLVLNESRFRIVADPKIIKDPAATAMSLAEVLKTSAQEIQTKLEADSRYEIIAQKQTKEVKEAIDNLKLAGIFTNEKTPLRVYIQGLLAPQMLGFVNDAGEGVYGIEQALNQELSGTAGRVKALTDQNNVPLLATGENILVDPIDGKNLVLTIDIPMQRQVEKLLKKGLDNAKSASGSIIVLEAATGAVKAMATFPTYDPTKYLEVEDPALYVNTAVSTPLEPGSIMKVLTTAAALDSGSVKENQSYFDPSHFEVDDAVVRNIEEDGGAQTRTISDILQYSLNTGATWLLMQMGGGEINDKGRELWYKYMTDHYGFGNPTGIEQGDNSEAVGIIPSPTEGYGLNIRYANTSFGQGMTVTPIQMAAAVAAVVNGGTYYQPHLLAGTKNEDGSISPITHDVVRKNVVSEQTSKTIIKFMNNVVEKNNRTAAREGYQVGGKTGTAEFARPEGGYYEDRFNGTYVGYVGGDVPEFVIMVRVDDPKVDGYAGSKAAGPIFADTANMLMDNFNVPRRTTTP